MKATTATPIGTKGSLVNNLAIGRELV